MPSQVGSCAIKAVHCVIARTKTRSKKSSSGVTRSSSRRTGPRRAVRACVVAASTAPIISGGLGLRDLGLPEREAKEALPPASDVELLALGGEVEVVTEPVAELVGSDRHRRNFSGAEGARTPD